MTENYVATSTITIEAAADRVWSVITNPDAAREFMFGTELVTDWSIGGPIRWRGVWEGKQYEDKGEVLEFEPGRRLVVTHFSPLTGQDDVPQNYHTLTWTLDSTDGATQLTLTQDNNGSREAAAHSKEMWDSLVRQVKTIAEGD
ncbi:MAG TPA: SRPBCC domain-containing protein [Microbacteriaceae bacterium]|jgi:uncharacterized protein YndB with AHSA1/START domain|nr:SRPBCC domain-containing protein [Microbacteriaceae bacterium]